MTTPETKSEEAMRFTPVPWRQGSHVWNAVMPVKSNSNGQSRICTVYGPDAIANLELIAAAPALFAACEAALAFAKKPSVALGRPPSELIAQLESALKLTGGKE